MKTPTGETWAQFFLGLPVSSWKLRAVQWHKWRLERALEAVGRHEAKYLELRVWAIAEQKKLR